MRSMPDLIQRLSDKDPIGVELGARHICFKCGWPFSNPHPNATQRRAHRKVCGTIEGYELMNLKGTTNESSPECHEVCSPEGHEHYNSLNAISSNFLLENTVRNHPTFATEDAKVNQKMALIGDDNAGDHDDKHKTENFHKARSESKEKGISLNLQLENSILARYPAFSPVDIHEVNQTTELIGGDNAGDHEKDKIEKCYIAGNESKEGAIEVYKNSLSEIVAVVENGTDDESAGNLGYNEPKHYTSSVSEIEDVLDDGMNDSTRNLGQTEPKYYSTFPSEIELAAEDARDGFKRILGQTEPMYYKAEKEPIFNKNTVSEVDQVAVEDGTNGSTGKLRQIEPNHYKSSVSEIEVVVEDGTDDSARILQKIGSKHFEFYGKHCEIQEECADKSSMVAKLSHSTGAVELLQNISQKPTLKELFDHFQVEDESSVKNTAAVMNNRTRDFDMGYCGNSYESSGFSSQKNAQSDVDAKALTSTDFYASSKAKKANLKNPNAATEQYHEEVLDDYERRICTPLFQVKERSKNVVNKSEWRKNIDGIFAKVSSLRKEKQNPLGGILDEVDLKCVLKARSESERKKSKVRRKPFLGRLGCCSSTGVIRSHKRKPRDWELQLQRYVSEYSPAW